MEFSRVKNELLLFLDSAFAAAVKRGEEREKEEFLFSRFVNELQLRKRDIAFTAKPPEVKKETIASTPSFLPTLITKKQVVCMKESFLPFLESQLPREYKGYNFDLSFSTEVHGFNLGKLFECARGREGEWGTGRRKRDEFTPKQPRF